MALISPDWEGNILPPSIDLQHLSVLKISEKIQFLAIRPLDVKMLTVCNKMLQLTLSSVDLQLI